jgi:hypothetical protein
MVTKQERSVFQICRYQSCLTEIGTALSADTHDMEARRFEFQDMTQSELWKRRRG